MAPGLYKLSPEMFCLKLWGWFLSKSYYSKDEISGIKSNVPQLSISLVSSYVFPHSNISFLRLQIFFKNNNNTKTNSPKTFWTGVIFFCFLLLVWLRFCLSLCRAPCFSQIRLCLVLSVCIVVCLSGSCVELFLTQPVAFHMLESYLYYIYI